ncbi:hypothetical protein Vi05172_g7016 [Venturia inaequalis]|nr:hypothetical protein Vi05172_g7016 [Venturia inaequalis]
MLETGPSNDYAMADESHKATRDDEGRKDGEMEEPENWPDLALELSSHPSKAKTWFKRYLRTDVFVWNFYRVHMVYFIVVIFMTSVIVYGEGVANDPTQINGSKLRYVDALFICTSAMTTTGLTNINLGDLTAFQQVVLAILMFIGNVTFVSIFVVTIRRKYFKRRLATMVDNSLSARKIVSDIEHQKAKKKEQLVHKLTGQSPTSSAMRKRLVARNTDAQRPKSAESQHHQTGMGMLPAPWEIKAVQRVVTYPFKRVSTHDWTSQDHSYLSFKPRLDERGRFRTLSEDERSELGGVEYRALGILLWVLIAYQVTWLLVGTVFLVPYCYRQVVVHVLHSAQSGHVNPGWYAFFVVISGFCNGGLNLLNANFIPLRGFYFILILEGALTVAGNTQFPILLRLTLWLLQKCTPLKSRVRQTLTFLLDHPRRCFIYLFPSKETWYLLFIQLSIDMVVWALFMVLNIGMPRFAGIPWGVRVFDGLFQATGLRTSGAYIIAISALAPALLVAYLVVMYISSYPIVMALRQTNTYEERSIGLERGDSKGSGGIGMHLRRQLAYDIWFQLAAWFFICIIERGKINRAEDGFDVFSILFEVTSAYGTVGLSTGVSYDEYSLVGAFQSLSKVIVMAVMLRGRHRGLPLAIDRSILLPGESLMKKMDKEYNGSVEECEKYEGEVRREEDAGSIKHGEEPAGDEGGEGSSSGKGKGKERGSSDDDEKPRIGLT